MKRLGERLKDLHFWRYELEREINDMTAETDDLVAMKSRLERALLAEDLALLIVTDNLNCRQTREGVDLCQDDVELNLLKVRLRRRHLYGPIRQATFTCARQLTKPACYTRFAPDLIISLSLCKTSDLNERNFLVKVIYKDCYY